jgi:DnaD/phage-associated family protein
MGSRTWIKIYCDKWLNGTIREESLEVRAVWVDLLVLAGSGRYGDSGEVKITDRVGFLDQQLADLMQISVQKWVACKKKLVETDRVEVSENNIIRIKNWVRYQSEYERTKQYSVRKSTLETTTKTTVGDRDKRLEIENRDRDTPLNPPVSLSLEQVIEVYEKNICLNGTIISEETENQLKFAVQQFSAAWVIDAIREACLQNNPTLRYIDGILRTWRKEGKSL